MTLATVEQGTQTWPYASAQAQMSTWPQVAAQAIEISMALVVE